MAAEIEMQEKLVSIMEITDEMQPGMDMAVKTFINMDRSVDGEIRIGNFPSEWRTPSGLVILETLLSDVFNEVIPFDQKPSMGGAFWISFGIRFGPQNESDIGEMAELYKRFRGLFQIATYHTSASHIAPMLNNVLGLKNMIQAVESSRGVPPSVLLIRFVWTPDGVRPARMKGEEGNR